jgi:cytochrome c oxidase assembly protein subunit 15
MATVVGFCATVLTLMAWGPGRTERGRWLIVWTFGIPALANLCGTIAMVLTPARFGLPPSLSSGKIISQGVTGEIGIVICAVVALLCRKPEERRWVRWLATSVLGMVIFQGVLGGLRVVLVKLDLAIVHACVAQAFFCLAALVCVVTSRWWIEAPDLSAAPKRVVWMSIACVLIVYSQLIVGAVMRHNQAGLAIPDLPLAYGKVLPPTSSEELAMDNQQLLRMIDSGENPRDRDLPRGVSMFQVWINFAHRCGALLVTGAILVLAIDVLVGGGYPGPIKGPVYLLLVLVAAQLTLGVLTIWLRKPADVASLHVAVGALVLVTSFILSVRGLRLYSSALRGPSKPQAAPLSACPFAEDAVPV